MFLRQRPSHLVFIIAICLAIFADENIIGCAGQAYYDVFSYDPNYYYLPAAGDQVKAETNEGWVYQYFTDFPYNGALISTIQTRVDGKRVRSILFTDNYGKKYNIGGDYATTEGEAKTYSLALANDERISYLCQQGDEDTLCRFYIQTVDKYGYIRQVELGGQKCGGNNGGTYDVASGLIGGFFGRAEGDPTRVKQLGILFLRKISSINFISTNITNYPSDPYASVVKGTPYTIDNRDSGLVVREPFTRATSQGYSYSYSYSKSMELLAGVAVSASYKHSTVTQTSESEVGGELSFEYGLSTETSTEKSMDMVTESSFSKEFCCPPYTYCSWTWYQGTGVIFDSDPADGNMETVVTFDTGYSWTLYDVSAYSGVSYDDSVTQVAVTDPVAEEGEDPFAICNEPQGRKLLQNEKSSAARSADHYNTFILVRLGIHTDQAIDLLTEEEKEKIKARLDQVLQTTFGVQGEIDLDALLKSFFEASVIPSGTLVRSVDKKQGFVSKIILD
jgi:hypothetical protein